MSERNWGCLDKMSEVNFSPAETLDRAQFMTNLANGCRKDMLIFCIFKRLSLFGLS